MPPVSVARTWMATVVAPEAMLGAMTEKSKGLDTSLATTLPLTSSSTLRTCTSSPTATLIGIEEPSTTVEGVPSRLAIEAVGPTPLVSKPR